jgi:hypothetical protein
MALLIINIEDVRTHILSNYLEIKQQGQLLGEHLSSIPSILSQQVVPKEPRDIIRCFSILIDAIRKSHTE